MTAKCKSCYCDDARAYVEKNLAKVQARRRVHYLANRETIIVKVVAYQRLRNTKPYIRMVNNLRRRVLSALAGLNKSSATLELLGCSRSELRAHLESKFQPGMTWENYGPVWHVDHKRPCASFDLTDPAQQRACFHWTNLQPLYATENMKKGARVSLGE